MDWLTRIERVCESPGSSKELRERVLALVAEKVRYDGHVFPLTDPATLVSTSPHAHLPKLDWSRLPEMIRLRYLTEINRVDRIVGGPAVSLLGATSDPAESLMWRDGWRDLGVVDTAVAAFADQYGTWGYLELTRSTPFTDDELVLLTALQPAVTIGLRRCVAGTFVDRAKHLATPGPAVVVLGPDLGVLSQTEAAGAALLQLLPPDEPMAPVPAAAYNIGAALLAAEAGVPIGEVWARVHLGGSRWVTVRASRLGADIAVSIEPSTASERLDLYGRCYGLSRREVDVLECLGAGLSSLEIAEDLVISEHTVNDHVKAVLAKTGARSRQVLLSRALGSAG